MVVKTLAQLPAPCLGRWVRVGQIADKPYRMHVYDAGTGDPVVMLHGNPTWSYYYRRLVAELAGDHRCIVPDHVGCGLSDRPESYEHTLPKRIEDLENLLGSMGLFDGGRRVTLVVHDWGGMIGLAVAAKHPQCVARLVILNTAAFPLPAGKPLPWTLHLARTPLLGAMLVRGLNLFVTGTLDYGVTRRQLSAAERSGYLAPYDTWQRREAVHEFVRAIPVGAHPLVDLVASVGEAIEQFRDRPMLICWGGRDFVFDDDFLAVWQQKFPQAELEYLADVGHLVLEDAHEVVVPRIRRFLQEHPIV